MVAARIATLGKGGDRRSEVFNAQICAPSQSQAAEQLQVSRRSAQHARQVIEKGTPELTSAVEQGKVKVSAAAEQLNSSRAARAARGLVASAKKGAPPAREGRPGQPWGATAS